MLNKIRSLLPQKEENSAEDEYKPVAYSFYTSPSVEFSAVCELFLEKIKSEQGWEILHWSDAESLLLQYRPEQKLKRKLGVEDTFVVTAAQEEEDKIVYSIAQVEGNGAERLDSPDDLPPLRKSGWFAEAHSETLHQMLGVAVWESFQEQLPIFSPDSHETLTGDTLVLPGGRYVGYEWGTAEQLFWHLQRRYDEHLLAALPVGKLKTWPEEVSPLPEATWWYLLSSHRSGWLGRAEDGTMQFIPHACAELVPHKEIGRDTIRSGRFVWEATGTSERYFHELQGAIALLDAPLRRVRELARLNWHHKVQHEASNQYAQLLLTYLVRRQGHPIDRLALFYTQFAQQDRNNALSLQSGRADQLQRGLRILPELLFLPEAATQFTDWAAGWRVSEADRLAIFHLLLRAGKDEALPYQKLLEPHRALRELFLKNEKDIVKKVWVEVEFCRHLIWAGQTDEGIDILEDTLEALPDEQLADLLPPQDLDLTGKLSGQVLRIQVLDLLIEAKGEKKARNHLAEAARLQPLVPERIESWLPYAGKDVKVRAETLAQTLKPGGLEPTENETETEEVHFQELSEKLLMKEVRHPASGEKSIKTTLQKWLAEAPKPDAQALRAFAQKLDPQEHAMIQSKITDIRQALGLPAVACYLTHGEKSVGVRAYPDETPFLVIGVEHLKPESPFFLRPTEWWFALAHELAYLRFGHVRLTSDAVWEGAKEKGRFALDTVLSVLPGISSLGSAMKLVPSLNRFASLLQQTQRLQQLADSGQQLVQLTSTAASLVSQHNDAEKTENDVQEQQLLATSRMMQLSADRTGLLIANDLPAAVRALFLTTPQYQPELDLVKKYGLTELLSKQNEDGTLRFQELAIRLAALFSFYLAEDFTLLQEELCRKG